MFLYKKPKKFSSKMQIVIAYLIYEDEVLFLRRKEDNDQGLMWTAPGGKKELNETKAQGVKREILEETGTNIKEEDFIFIGDYYVKNSYLDFTISIYKTYLNEKPEIQLSPSEHDRYLWLTAREALKLKLLPDADCCLYAGFPSLKSSAIPSVFSK